MPRSSSALDVLATYGGRLRGRPVAGYALALVTTLVGLAVRLALDGAFPPGFPFLTFFPAILISAFVAGPGPGALSGILALVFAWLFLLPLRGAGGGEAIMPLLFFGFVFATEILLVTAMQNALDRLADAQAVSDRLYQQQRTLYQELQHRVANNMAFVGSLLRLQKRSLASDASRGVQAFDEAIDRIETMGRIHRRLYDPEAANLLIETHFCELCEELTAAAGRPEIRCEVALPGLEVPLDKLLPLSLLIAELVTNSLKHGFAGRDGGLIRIALEVSPDAATIVVADNGVGLAPETGARRTGGGLGLRIIDGLAAQLRARLTTESGDGVVTRIMLPR